MKTVSSWEKELLQVLTETPTGISSLLSYPVQVSESPCWLNLCTKGSFENEGSLRVLLVQETDFNLNTTIWAFSVWRRGGSMWQVPTAIPTIAGIWNYLPAFTMTSVSCRTKFFLFLVYFDEFSLFLQNALPLTGEIASKMLCNGYITTL